MKRGFSQWERLPPGREREILLEGEGSSGGEASPGLSCVSWMTWHLPGRREDSLEGVGAPWTEQGFLQGTGSVPCPASIALVGSLLLVSLCLAWLAVQLPLGGQHPSVSVPSLHTPTAVGHSLCPGGRVPRFTPRGTVSSFFVSGLPETKAAALASFRLSQRHGW